MNTELTFISTLEKGSIAYYVESAMFEVVTYAGELSEKEMEQKASEFCDQDEQTGWVLWSFDFISWCINLGPVAQLVRAETF